MTSRTRHRNFYSAQVRERVFTDHNFPFRITKLLDDCWHAKKQRRPILLNFFFRQQSSPEEPLQSQVKRQRSIIREVLLLFLCRSSACLSPLMVDTITAVNL